jgi:hypothetical protein
VTVNRFPTGRLRVSRVLYLTNLQRTDSLEIPVGIVGEATLPTLRAIASAFRPTFDAGELKLVGPLMRDVLKNPSAALWPEIVEIFEKSEPGIALDEFAQRHTSSLSVLAPEPIDVPRQWLLERSEDRLSEIVSDRMKTILTDEYFKLLFPPRDDSAVQPPRFEEKVALLAAVAA